MTKWLSRTNKHQQTPYIVLLYGSSDIPCQLEKVMFSCCPCFFWWFSLQRLRIWSWDRSCRTTLVAFSPLASLVTSRRQNPGIEDPFVKDRGIGNPWLWELLGCYSCYCGFGIKITSRFFLPRNWNFNALECLCSFAIVVSLPRKFKTFSSLTFKHFCHASHASQIDRFTSHHQFLLPTSHIIETLDKDTRCQRENSPNASHRRASLILSGRTTAIPNGPRRNEIRHGISCGSKVLFSWYGIVHIEPGKKNFPKFQCLH